MSKITYKKDKNMAGMQSEESIIIQAPIEKIYAYVSDYQRHIEWNHQPNEMTGQNLVIN